MTDMNGYNDKDWPSKYDDEIPQYNRVRLTTG